MNTGSILLSWPQQPVALAYAIRYRRIRPSYTNWVDTRVQAPSLRLDNQISGTYEFQISSIGLFGTTSSPTLFTYTLNVEATQSTITSQNLSPITLTPLSPELALLEWSVPTATDTTLLVRHQQPTNAPEWGAAASVLPPIPADHSHAYVPLLDGVYLARLDGSVSTTSVHITRPAPSRTFIAELEEAPAFAGTKINVTTNSVQALQLTAALRVDDLALGEDLDSYGVIDQLGLVDTYPMWDTSALFDSISLIDNLGPGWDGLTSIDGAGGISPTGDYFFANTIDAGAICDIYLRRKLVIATTLLSSLFDDRSALVDTWLDIDSLEPGSADAALYTRTSTDNLSWSEWQPIVSGLFRARYLEFKLHLTTADPTNNITVASLGVVAEC